MEIKTKTFLITAVGGDLSQSVIRCIKESKYGKSKLIGIDANNYAAGKADVDMFYRAPMVKDKEDYLNFINELILKNHIDYVLFLSDVEIGFYNKNRDLFLNKAIFIVNEKWVIDTFSDKYKTIKFFQDNNIPYPKTFLPSDFNNQLYFPIVLKKRKGSGSSFVFIVNNREELNFYLNKYKDMVIQEYIPFEDDEYTACIFKSIDKTYTITFKRKLGAGGFSQEVVLDNNKEIDDFVKQVAIKINFIGSINLQFRAKNNNFFPFEINPRFSSTVYFRHFFGFKDVEWSIDSFEKINSEYFQKYKHGVGVRRFNETFFDLK